MCRPGFVISRFVSPMLGIRRPVARQLLLRDSDVNHGLSFPGLRAKRGGQESSFSRLLQGAEVKWDPNPGRRSSD